MQKTPPFRAGLGSVFSANFLYRARQLGVMTSDSNTKETYSSLQDGWMLDWWFWFGHFAARPAASSAGGEEMTVKKRSTPATWKDPDDAPELTEEFFKNADLYEI